MSGPDPSPPFLPRLLLRPSARQALPLLAAAFAFSLLLTAASNGRQGFVEDSSLSPSSARHLARKRALGLPNCVNGQGRARKEIPLEEEVENADTPARVFVSMAVCWSANTKLHHKATFPYRLATRFDFVLIVVLRIFNVVDGYTVAAACVIAAALAVVVAAAVVSVTVAAVAAAVLVVPFAGGGVMLAIPTQGILYRYSLESP